MKIYFAREVYSWHSNPVNSGQRLGRCRVLLLKPATMQQSPEATGTAVLRRPPHDKRGLMRSAP